jgi:peptidoglycan/LPS O-acetylase OafA/YrhL
MEEAGVINAKPELVMTNAKKYYSYLDTYRFIAVFLVIMTHYLPSVLGKFAFSNMGVDMFFVLSGFLITEILIKSFAKSEIKSNSVKSRLKVFFYFYVRRSLRIFPIYYLVIIFFFILGNNYVSQYPGYFFLYGVNYLIIHLHHWVEYFSHLWSLAVEEQFYIFWPLIISFFLHRRLNVLLLTLIGASLLFLFITAGIRQNNLYLFHTFSAVSTLGTGAFLAWLKTQNKIAGWSKIKENATLVTLLILILIFNFVNIPYTFFALHVLHAAFSFIVLKILITRENGFLDTIFKNRVTSFLGKISYGLYLYNDFMPWLYRCLNGTETEMPLHIPRILPTPKNGIMMLGIHWMLLIIVSICSWYIIEKPLSNLKKYFSYSE